MTVNDKEEIKEILSACKRECKVVRKVRVRNNGARCELYEMNNRNIVDVYSNGHMTRYCMKVMRVSL